MTKRPIRHRIEKTGNKHSRAVFKDDTIVIRLARGLSKVEEKEHIDDLLERMTRQVIEEREKNLIDPFRPLLDGGQSVTVTVGTGKKYTFSLLPGTRNHIQRTTKGFKVTVAPHVRRSQLHRLLWNALSKAELPRIEKLIQELNERTYGIKIAKVRLKFASSQWGSCSPKRIIMVNTALLFTQPSILKYVIIHELAHRKVANHSPLYWKWVRWAMPRYDQAKELLNEYRLPSL